MTRQHNEATARILAATLTLVSREQKGMQPPFSLWYPELAPKDIRDLALDVAFDRSKVLWADDSHPARGLLIFHPQALEGSILGHGSARLKGPYVVDPDQASRQRVAQSLAGKGKALARREGMSFLSAKLPQDPALVRGFCAVGFEFAEASTVLVGPIEKEPMGGTGPKPQTLGVTLRGSEEEDVHTLLSQLGDLFYDGHHLHGPFLPEDFHRKLWRRVAEDGLSAGDVAVFAKDQRQGVALGFAMAKLQGQEATLSILHVNEERRNQGLGGLMMRHLLGVLRDKGASSIRAETAAWNLPALSLYLSLGLRPRAPLVALHAMLHPL
ncbi:MAG: GNAT family N-acetyltransferase [Deltaproteobacteria bacterium]|nr:GNAT family N-acetyltransferase [Deltaproteobacteria bacterium]